MKDLHLHLLHGWPDPLHGTAFWTAFAAGVSSQDNTSRYLARRSLTQVIGQPIVHAHGLHRVIDIA